MITLETNPQLADSLYNLALDIGQEPIKKYLRKNLPPTSTLFKQLDSLDLTKYENAILIATKLIKEVLWPINQAELEILKEQENPAFYDILSNRLSIMLNYMETLSATGFRIDYLVKIKTSKIPVTQLSIIQSIIELIDGENGILSHVENKTTTECLKTFRDILMDMFKMLDGNEKDLNLGNQTEILKKQEEEFYRTRRQIREQALQRGENPQLRVDTAIRHRHSAIERLTNPHICEWRHVPAPRAGESSIDQAARIKEIIAAAKRKITLMKEFFTAAQKSFA